MAVLFEEVVLYVKNVVEAQLVGELDLLQRLLDDAMFVIWAPLVLIRGSR